jgi:hypothetical protein
MCAGRVVYYGSVIIIYHAGELRIGESAGRQEYAFHDGKGISETEAWRELGWV